MRRCVRSRNLKNEEAMACVGPQRHRKKEYISYVPVIKALVNLDIIMHTLILYVIQYLSKDKR